MPAFINNYLNKVKNKSAHERELLAFAWAIGLTSLIAGLWAINLLYVVSGPKPKVAETSNNQSWTQGLTANAALVGAGLGVVRDQFRAILDPSK